MLLGALTSRTRASRVAASSLARAQALAHSKLAMAAKERRDFTIFSRAGAPTGFPLRWLGVPRVGSPGAHWALRFRALARPSAEAAKAAQSAACPRMRRWALGARRRRAFWLGEALLHWLRTWACCRACARALVAAQRPAKRKPCSSRCARNQARPSAGWRRPGASNRHTARLATGSDFDTRSAARRDRRKRRPGCRAPCRP